MNATLTHILSEKDKEIIEYSLSDGIHYMIMIKCPKCSCGIALPF